MFVADLPFMTRAQGSTCRPPPSRLFISKCFAREMRFNSFSGSPSVLDDAKAKFLPSMGSRTKTIQPMQSTDAMVSTRDTSVPSGAAGEVKST